MLLGALVDCGLPMERLREELAKLPVSGYSLEAQLARRGVVRGTQVAVRQDAGSASGYTIADFLSMLEESTLSHTVSQRARDVLERLEAAETRVHGEGHGLEELGDLDTVIDVVGVVAGLEALGIEKLYSSPLPCGWGVVATRKGALPVPAPATAALIAMAKARVVPPQGAYLKAGELVTPTGAALITTLASFETPSMTVERMGYGVGSRDIAEIPNVLALWIGESDEAVPITQVSLLETNIDDSTPEVLGYLQEELLRQGALDAWFTPIQMKKNRPGVTLSVLCRPPLESSLVKLILKESTTLGIRVHHLDRHEAEREVIAVDTSLGMVGVKVKRVEGNVLGVSPEYEDCREIARRAGLPLLEVYRKVEMEARATLGIG
ncbi:MAG: nickel pincer cofactor biosynthesis protein LarC [Chloroflexi bacterium]|nr:nickel pincer cofactor biosynthesis protein LarC [Chloroflexota bacterium]